MMTYRITLRLHLDYTLWVYTWTPACPLPSLSLACAAFSGEHTPPAQRMPHISPPPYTLSGPGSLTHPLPYYVTCAYSVVHHLPS